MSNNHIQVGSGPYFVSYSRDTEGTLQWLEIVSEEEAIFRADKPPKEEDLYLAVNMVNAYNSAKIKD